MNLPEIWEYNLSKAGNFPISNTGDVWISTNKLYLEIDNRLKEKKHQKKLKAEAADIVAREKYINELKKENTEIIEKPKRPQTIEDWKKIIVKYKTLKSMASYLGCSTITIYSDLKKLKTNITQLKQQIKI